MVRRWLRSPVVSVFLFLALVGSLVAHALRGGGEGERAQVHVVALDVGREGPSTQVTVDFDAEMTGPAGLGVVLGAEAVSLEPATPVLAKFVTPRRLLVEPRAPLVGFSTYRVRLGAGIAAIDGRPLSKDASGALEFESSVLALDEPPLARVDGRERACVELAWNGTVAEGDLREHLRLVAPGGASIPFDLSGEGRRYTLTCAGLPPDGSLLVVAAGLRPRTGSNGLRAPLRVPLAWPRALGLERVVAEEGEGGVRTIRATFSHPLAAQDLRGLVVTSPAVASLLVRADGNEATLTGAFVPGTSVVVTAKAGLRSGGGLRLEKDARRTVRIPEPSPDVRLASRGSFLSSDAVPELMLVGVNVPEVLVELRRVYANNLVPLALDWASPYGASGPVIERRLPVDAAPNERWTRPLDLAGLAGERPRGVWHVRVSDPRSRWNDDVRLLQISDLAPVVRVRPEGLVVFVTRLSDGRAVAGAKVVAWTAQNQPATDGVTDATGLLVVRGVRGAIRIVTVATPDDLVYVDLDAHEAAHDARDVGGRDPAPGLEAWVRAERGLVRPGEVARADVIVRTPRGEAPPEGLPVVVRVKGPDRRVVRRLERTLPPSGLLDLDVPLALDAPTGTYVVEVAGPGGDAPLGRDAFRVEAFVPDRLEASLEVPAGDLELGTEVGVRVTARLLGGDPAAGRAVRLRPRFEPVASEALPGFVFGDAGAAPTPFEGDAVEGTLGADGAARLEVPLPSASAAGLALRATFSVDVIDVSGRAVTAAAVRGAVPTGPRLGVGVPTGAALAFPVALLGTTPERVEADLERITTHGRLVVERGRFVWRDDERVEALATVPVPLEGGRGVATFPRAADGRLRVRVRARGVAPAVLEVVAVDGHVRPASPSESDGRLALRAVGGPARPGSTSTVEVDAPFAGRGLLTVEGAGVLSARVVDLPAGSTRLPVAVPEDAGPSVHATLTLVRGLKDPGDGPVRRLGAVAIAVARPERALTVSLEAASPSAPEAPLRVTVRTSEPADVRLHLVDEGVLRKTRHADPDPSGWFAATRRLDTKLSDAYTRLVDRQRFAADDPDPGGDGDAEGGPVARRLDPTARVTIETVALASRRLAVDGSAEVTFDLPAYEGRLRLVAVAASRRGTGAAATDVVVKGPISVAVHAPRAVAPGDTFLAAVEISGEGVEHVVELDGLEREGDGLPLRLRALDRPGLASIRVLAKDAAGHTAVRTAKLSVRPAAAYASSHAIRTLAAGERLDEALPGAFLAGTRRARVTVGSGPLTRLLPAFDRLREYPHGCIEQTTSRAFPILAWSAIARLSAPDGGAPEDTVDAAIERILSMQTSEGGFAAWPGVRAPYPYGSAWATAFLVEARRLGRDVPADRLGLALDFMEKRLRLGRASPYEGYVLTIAGRPTGPWLESLVDRETTLEDRARLAASFLRLGDAARARALLPTSDDPWAAPRDDGDELGSPLRVAATLLDALTEVAPGDPRIPALVLRLTERVTGSLATTTQEDATVLLALAHHHAKEAVASAGLTGRLRVGDAEAAISGPEGATLALEPGAPWTFGVEVSAPTTVVIRVEGVPLVPEREALSNGASIRRTIEGGAGARRQGRVYRVTLEGVVPDGARNVLVTDVLPGGFEIERVSERDGTFDPDRVEARDDRVLFFRSDALPGAKFTQSYLVRAVTPGRFRLPASTVELLYEPATRGRSAAEGEIEIVR